MFSVQEIMRNVPHRYPFLLIDRIIDFTPDTAITALKNITMNEAQFQGHFPGNPVFPGVYIIESMAQTACFLLSKSSGGLKEDTVYYLGRVKNASFKTPVVPGDQLITRVTIQKKMGDNAMVDAESTVKGAIVAASTLMFAARNV